MSLSVRDRTAARFARASTALAARRDDSLIDCWDALLWGNIATAASVSPTGLPVIQQLRAIDDVMQPGSEFLDQLEREIGTWDHAVASAGSSSTTALVQTAPRSLGHASGSALDTRNVALSRKARTNFSLHTRRIPMRVALAVVTVLILAGLAVLYRAYPSADEPAAIPAAVSKVPTMETLIQLDFIPPMWDMPDATSWTHMDFSIIELAPGKSFSTEIGWYTSTDGPLLLMVLSGQVTMRPAGPALFYSPEDHRSREPIAAGERVTLDPNAAIVYSISDTGVGTNQGNEPMIALIGLTGTEDFSVPSFMPVDVRSLDFNYVDGMTVLPTAGASVSIQRLELAPYDSFVFDPDATLRYLPAFESSRAHGVRMFDGALDTLFLSEESQNLYQSVQLKFLGVGPHTLVNLGDATVDLYFLVLEPLPDAGTPTARARQAPQLCACR